MERGERKAGERREDVRGDGGWKERRRRVEREGSKDGERGEERWRER